MESGSQRQVNRCDPDRIGQRQAAGSDLQKFLAVLNRITGRVLPLIIDDEQHLIAIELHLRSRRDGCSQAQGKASAKKIFVHFDILRPWCPVKDLTVQIPKTPTS